MIEAKGSYTKIIAKIEKPEALDNINEIIAATDGIMVARGDLGVQIPGEQVPIWQKKIIRNVIEKVACYRGYSDDGSVVDNPRPEQKLMMSPMLLDGTDAAIL